MKSIVAGMALALGLTAGVAAAGDAQKATASFVDDKGKAVGKATLTQTSNGVLIALELNGIPAGEHAFHIHEKGVCDPAGKFESAGAHFNPEKKPHGYMAQGGTHAGDMPNLFAGSDGVVKIEVLNTQITLGSGPGSLFAAGTVGGADAGAGGKALVMHAKADDYKSQPSGEAGGRIACAVIKKD